MTLLPQPFLFLLQKLRYWSLELCIERIRFHLVFEFSPVLSFCVVLPLTEKSFLLCADLLTSLGSRALPREGAGWGLVLISGVLCAQPLSRVWLSVTPGLQLARLLWDPEPVIAGPPQTFVCFASWHSTRSAHCGAWETWLQ